MSWNVPSHASSDNNSDRISVWPGIGSGNSSTDQLIQAGTESEQDMVLGIYHNEADYAWYEAYPLEPEVNVFTVNPGDQMYVDVNYDPSTAEALFLVEDETTGIGVDMQQAVPGSGSTDEWIAERPSLGGNYQQLGNFGTEYLANAGGMTSTTSSPLRPRPENRHHKHELAANHHDQL